MAKKFKHQSCPTCGVLWIDHAGIAAVCAENARLKRILASAQLFKTFCYFCLVPTDEPLTPPNLIRAITHWRNVRLRAESISLAAKQSPQKARRKRK